MRHLSGIPHTLVLMPQTKTDRFLASFAAVTIIPEYRNMGDHGPALVDCGISPGIASKLICWAEACGEPLTCTFEQGTSGRVVQRWSWEARFLQAAFKKHTELFGDADLSESARQMRDRGRFRYLEG